MTSKDMTPMVSVVLPAYKGGFFKEAVQSILAQTYKDFELIIVDDASPFDFPSVLREFKDDRISYYRNDENIGGKDLAEVFASACCHAVGKYAVFASDDDVYQPSYLDEMVELAELHPECSLFSCRVGHIDESGRMKNPGVPVLDHETFPYFIWMHEVNGRHLTLPEWFIRKSSLNAIGGIARYPLLWFSDTQTMYQLASYRNGGVYFSQKMLMLYRDSNAQMSNPSRGVMQKTEATIAFYGWLCEFIRKLCKDGNLSREDIILIEGIKEAIPRRAKNLLLQLGRNVVGLSSLWKYVSQVTSSPYMKTRDVGFLFASRCLNSLAKVFHAN